MKLYDCKTAPSARRVRVFLAEKGVDIPRIEVDLRAGEHLQPAFRTLNPYCTVPVVELDDGTLLRCTAAIWRYFEETCPDPPLMGRTPTEKARVAGTQWRIESDGFTAIAEWLRNAAPGMKDRALTGPTAYAQIAQLAERGKRRTAAFLESLENLAALADPFLCGTHFSVADIDAMIAVDFARQLHLELPAGASSARRWYERVASRPSASA